MAVTATIDPVRQERFVHKVLGDTSAWFVTMMAALGDRLALFKDLAANGPADSRELAARAGVNERYAREWLGCMAAAGYLDYDTDTGRFTLPLEHTAALANEAGPFFFGGVHQMIADLPVILDHCMTTSLANNGAGLGTLFHERKAHELCREAGFSSVRRLPLENPFNNVYEVRP